MGCAIPPVHQLVSSTKVFAIGVRINIVGDIVAARNLASGRPSTAVIFVHVDSVRVRLV